MTRVHYRFSTMLCLVLGILVLLSRGLAPAVPPKDDCSDRCFERKEFIFSPSLACRYYADEDCYNCVNGRCKDTLVGPVPPCRDTEDRVTVFGFDDCEPICNLNLNQASQANLFGLANDLMYGELRRRCIP